MQIKFIKPASLLVCTAFLTMFFAAICAAQTSMQNSASQYSSTSTDDILNEIERSLLFSNEEKMLMTPVKSGAKSDFSIKEGDDQAKNSSFEMKISEKNFAINFDARSKEKMAYNAAISGQYEVAIELYKQVLAVEPDNNYATFSLALIYQKIRQFAQAKNLYYKLLQNNAPNREEIIGNILSVISEESPKDAIYLLSRLAMQHPNSPYILTRSAFAYSNAKNYKKAISMMKRAIEIEPNRIDYRYNLAIIYDQAELFEKAVETYNDVLKLYNFDDNYSATIPLEQIKKRVSSLKNKIYNSD